MRTPHQILNDNTYAGVNYIDPKTAIKCMEDYASDKQARIDELEYKLSFLLSNIKLCKNKFDEEIIIANSQLKKDVFGDMVKLLDIVSTIPEVTATVTTSAQ